MSPLFLPDSEQALHEQTYHCNADPTEETESQRLSTCFDQFDDIGIQTYCGHSKHNEKFA